MSLLNKLLDGTQCRMCSQLDNIYTGYLFMVNIFFLFDIELNQANTINLTFKCLYWCQSGFAYTYGLN